MDDLSNLTKAVCDSLQSADSGITKAKTELEAKAFTFLRIMPNDKADLTDPEKKENSYTRLLFSGPDGLLTFTLRELVNFEYVSSKETNATKSSFFDSVNGKLTFVLNIIDVKPRLRDGKQVYKLDTYPKYVELKTQYFEKFPEATTQDFFKANSIFSLIHKWTKGPNAKCIKDIKAFISS